MNLETRMQRKAEQTGLIDSKVESINVFITLEQLKQLGFRAHTYGGHRVFYNSRIRSQYIECDAEPNYCPHAQYIHLTTKIRGYNNG